MLQLYYILIQNPDVEKIKFQYGRTGTPTSRAFCDTMAELYNADGSIIAPSGLAAAVVGILSFVKAEAIF